MGIFDVFTGAPARRAAEQTRTHLAGVERQGLADLNQAYATAPGYITSATTGARGDITGGTGTARGDVTAGFGGALDQLGQGGQLSLDALSRARTAGTDAYAPLTGLASKYGGASSLLLDALGVNGEGGAGRAKAAFTTGPGYQFQVDEAINAINRGRNASGQLAGGNTDQSILDRASGLAGQEYGSYLDRLAGFAPLELSATSGAAGGLAELARSLGISEADLQARMGTAGADLMSRQGTTLGQLATGEGSALAGLRANEGQSLANLATGRAQATTGLRTGLAQPYTNTYGQEAAAQMQGSGNLWGLGMNLATLGAGQFGRNGAFGQGGAFGAPIRA